MRCFSIVLVLLLGTAVSAAPRGRITARGRVPRSQASVRLGPKWDINNLTPRQRQAVLRDVRRFKRKHDTTVRTWRAAKAAKAAKATRRGTTQRNAVSGRPSEVIGFYSGKPFKGN